MVNDCRIHFPEFSAQPGGCVVEITERQRGQAAEAAVRMFSGPSSSFFASVQGLEVFGHRLTGQIPPCCEGLAA